MALSRFNASGHNLAVFLPASSQFQALQVSCVINGDGDPFVALRMDYCSDLALHYVLALLKQFPKEDAVQLLHKLLCGDPGTQEVAAKPCHNSPWQGGHSPEGHPARQGGQLLLGRVLCKDLVHRVPLRRGPGHRGLFQEDPCCRDPFQGHLCCRALASMAGGHSSDGSHLS